MKAQYAKLGGSFQAGFKELADGYDYRTNLPKNQNFYIGSTRNASLGKAMDVNKLYDLIEDSYMQFNDAIQAQIDIIARGESIIKETEESGGSTTSSVDLAFLKTVFSERQLNEIKKNNSLMAFQGFTDKVDANRQLDYWQPIIYISSDEFQQLMEKLQPVMAAAGTGNRKPYVEALKELTRSMLPGITAAEMESKDVGEIMALVSGLNVKSRALTGLSIAQIQSEEQVPQVKFDELIASFRDKYSKLKKIRENKYDFSVERNKTTWYWIPVEDLP